MTQIQFGYLMEDAEVVILCIFAGGPISITDWISEYKL